MTDAPATPDASVKPKGALLTAAYGGIGFGALGLCTPLFVIGSRALTQLLNRAQHENAGLMALDDTLWGGSYGTWTKISMALATVTSALLLTAGYGLSKRRAWGRQLGFVWAAFHAFLTIANATMVYLLLVPALHELKVRFPRDAGVTAGALTAVPSMAFGVLMASALIVAMVVLLLRRDVRAQLER